MTDPFEEQLQATLHAQASQLPHGTSMGEAAVGRARRVRRRRTAAGATVAGVLTVVAVSASVLHAGANGAHTVTPAEPTPMATATATPTVSSTSTPTPTVSASPSTVVISDPAAMLPATLPQGAPAQVPVVRRTTDGHYTVTDGDRQATFATTERPVDGFRVDGGWLVRTMSDSGQFTVRRVSEGGAATTVLRGNVTGLVKQPDGAVLATAVDGADTVLRVVGATQTQRLPGHWRPAGFLDDDRLVLTPATYEDADAAAAPVWSLRSSAVVATLPARLRPAAAAGGRIAGVDLTQHGPVDGEPCGVVVSADAPGTDLWASCELSPYLLTATGTAVMFPAYFDGLGPGRVSLVDVATRQAAGDWLIGTRGQVLEDPTHVLLLAGTGKVNDESHHSLVRCDEKGTCERAGAVEQSQLPDDRGVWLLGP